MVGIVVVNYREYGRTERFIREEIARIREILASDGSAKNIGLYNVYSRLAICMGRESTLDVERPEEGGTRVVICWRISPA